MKSLQRSPSCLELTHALCDLQDGCKAPKVRLRSWLFLIRRWPQQACLHEKFFAAESPDNSSPLDRASSPGDKCPPKDAARGAIACKSIGLMLVVLQVVQRARPACVMHLQSMAAPSDLNEVRAIPQPAGEARGPRARLSLQLNTSNHIQWVCAAA